MIWKTWLFLLVLSGGITVLSKEYFVSPSGADGNPGTRSAPFAAIRQASGRTQPGDIVTLLPGIYFETVRIEKFGTPDHPIVYRAEKPGTAIVTGADREIREGRRLWKPVDPALGLYAVDYDKPQPSRVLYDNVDLFPYGNLELLKAFAATPDTPGPRHGFAVDAKNRKLYVRLRADGKYGSPDPNRHTMAVSPAPYDKYGRQYSLADKNSVACNFRIPGKKDEPLWIVIDGIVFETPGRTAIAVSGSHLAVRNCLFNGCWRGGVESVGPASFVTVENCEWHSFPVFDDVKELLAFPDAFRKDGRPWMHKSSSRGAVVPYETGICQKIGRDWSIRGCYIHDCFEGLCGAGSGTRLTIENNRFVRCVDNAVELENHGVDLIIRANRFEDVFQAISWQPLDGKPWPGPVYICRNLFYRTPPYQDMWSKKGGGTPFKIGAPAMQWKNPALKENLKNVDKTHLAVPGGLWIYNNTIVEPEGPLIMELNWSHQRIDNIHFYNNLIVAGKLRQYSDQWENGGSSHYNYVNNRIWWQHTVPLVPSLNPQSLSGPGEVLPGFRKGDFRPAVWAPSAEVPGATEKFPFVGAYQNGNEEIAPSPPKQEHRKKE